MTAAGIALVITTVVLVVAGLWALAAPGSFVAVSRRTARRIHLPYARWLDKTLYVDRIIYRFHRGVGLALWLASCAILAVVLFGLDPAAGRAAPGAHNWLLQALIALITVAGVVGFAFAVVMILRPSAVKPLEAWGNRWVDLPEHLLDRRVKSVPVEAWAAGHTRLFGAVVLAAGLAVAWLVF